MSRRAFCRGIIGSALAGSLARAQSPIVRAVILDKLPVSVSAGLGLQTNLSAFWSLEEAAGNSRLDNVANLALAETGGTVAQVTGKVGFGAQLTTSTSLQCATSSAVNLAGGDFSIACWMLTNASAASSPEIHKDDGAFGNREFSLASVFGTGFQFQFTVIDTSGTQAHLTAATFGNLATNTWYDVVVTYDHTNKIAKIYVNGTLSDSTTFALATVAATTSDFQLNNPNSASATIDQVGLWKGRILSASDVSLLYNGGAGLSYAAMA